MPEIDTKEFENDMKDLETRIKMIRAEYNQYLNGSLKVPPNFSVAFARKIIRKYASAKGLKGYQRFLYFNLVAKFNTMMEFYGRRVREKQEGKRITYGYIKKDKETAETRKKPTRAAAMPRQPPRGHIISDVKRQTATMRSMFETWNEMVERSRAPTPQLDFDKFQKLIQAKTMQIRKAKGCRAVRYRIAMENGKVKIKAKPIQ